VNVLQFGKHKIITMILAIFSSVALAGCRAPGAATTSRAGVEPFFKSTEGLALKGYDAVAYFTEGKPVDGRSEFAAEWNGAKWYFASARNRQMFLGEPDKYAPQYGGYCSWAVGHGYTAKGDPEAWKIVDGKLYLNYNQEVRTKWEQETPALISKGDENWLAFQKTRPEHKGEGSN
jgi:YHS domain-containing protein